jgi:hypothetical protein
MYPVRINRIGCISGITDPKVIKKEEDILHQQKTHVQLQGENQEDFLREFQ